MKPGIRTAFGLFCLALALGWPLAAAAAEYPIAEPIVKRTDITWNVVIQHEGLTLSVRGRDCVLAEDFRVGETPKLDPSDFADMRLEDGHYTWELRAVPVIAPSIRELLADTRRLDDPKAEKELAMQLRRDGRIPWQPITQAGNFTIDRGLIILDEPETRAGSAEQSDGDGPIPTTKDTVISNDLIVNNSLCVGSDCVNNENFGFDTIRLKENNLRIKLDDTSTIAGFPSRDWQLTANDSAAGGASKFSIDDITGARTPFTVEAGSPSHSLFVDDGGRIGNGTATPSVEIHTVNGDTPTLRLQQDGSSGFAPQTWDIAGNETNFFVRDVTNGSALPFRIRPGAPSSSLMIDDDGSVGLGTASPGQKLDVAGGDVKIGRTTGGQTSLFLENTGGTATSSWILRANGANGAFTFTEAGGNTAFKINAGARTNAMVLTANGIEVSGSITQNAVVIHPDYVFEPSYALLPIEKQGEYMTANKHLPAVGPGRYNATGEAVINLGEHQLGMLEELEKAHLYIQQLDAELAASRDAIADLRTRLAKLEAAQD